MCSRSGVVASYGSLVVTNYFQLPPDRPPSPADDDDDDDGKRRGLQLAFVLRVSSLVRSSSGQAVAHPAALSVPELNASPSPVVLINGWGGVKEDYAQMAAALVAQTGRDVLTFDHRGMGQSDALRGLDLTRLAAEAKTAAAKSEAKGAVVVDRSGAVPASLPFSLEQLAVDAVRLIEHVFGAQPVNVVGLS